MLFVCFLHHDVKDTSSVYFIDSDEGLIVFKKASHQLITDNAKTSPDRVQNRH